MDLGNPNATNYYDRLGVSESDDCDEIEDVAREIIPEYHPDRNPDTTTEVFQRIKEARSVLTDEEKRNKYDTGKVSLQITPEAERVSTGTTVEINVVDGYGEGIPKARVTVDTESNSFETNGNGTVTVPLSEPGKQTLLADKHDYDTIRYVPAEVDIIVEEREKELFIRLNSQTVQTGDEISVLVTDDQDSPVSNATVIIKNGEGDTKRRQTGPNGVVAITLETTGKYHLTTQKSGFVKDETSLIVNEKIRLSITVTTNKIQVNTPFTAIVTDQHGDPIQGVSVVLRNKSKQIDSDYSDSDGKVQLTAVGETVHTLATRGSDAQNTQRDIYVMGTSDSSEDHENDQAYGKDDVSYIFNSNPFETVVSSIFGSRNSQQSDGRNTTGSANKREPGVFLSTLFAWVTAFPVLSRMVTIALIIGGGYLFLPEVVAIGSGVDFALIMGGCILSFIGYDLGPKYMSTPGIQKSDIIDEISPIIISASLTVGTLLVFAGQGTVGETLGAVTLVTLIPIFQFILVAIIFGLFGLVVGAFFGDATGGGTFGAIIGGGLVLVMQFSTMGPGVKDEIQGAEDGISNLPWIIIDDLTIWVFDIGTMITFALSVFTLVSLVLGSILGVLILFHHPRQRELRDENAIPLCWEIATIVPLVLFIWGFVANSTPLDIPILQNIFGNITLTETGIFELIWLPFLGITIVYGLREKM